MKTKKEFLTFLIISVALFFAGCASIGTVKPQLDDPQFQSENLPVRVLRVAVFSDGKQDEDNIRALIAESSSVLGQQVGITLNIVSFNIIPDWLEDNSRMGMVNGIFNISHKNLRTDEFEIVIGVIDYSVATVVFGGIYGVIDDTWRRYIVVPVFTTHNLLHEVGHCFIFNHTHGYGLMTGILIGSFPGLPAFNETLYFSPSDRREVLKNKWRNFDEKPVLNKEDVEDIITEKP